MENKYVRVMDGDVSNASGLTFKINEVNVCDDWHPEETDLDKTGGINFSNEENILRWIRRGNTIYEVELPPDAEMIKLKSTFTPNGLFRTNKMIVKNPRKLTEDVVEELYRKSNLPDTTYYTVLGILAQKEFDHVAMNLLRDKVNKENIDIVLKYFKEYKDEHKDVSDNPGLYYKYLDILEEIASDIEICLTVDKESYIRDITNDKVINLAGQSGSGKSYYARENFYSDDYLVIDTDDVFSEHRFDKSTGINKELGEYFRNKYEELPNLGDDFDLIYKEILNYCNKYDKTIVIDSAQFHCISDPTILKGKIIIIRTCIDTCYKRCIDRFIAKNSDYSEEELNSYKRRKSKIYIWYKSTNQFIKNLDLFLNNKELHLKEIREKNKNYDFTLLTNNCLAGYIYHDLGLKFLTPTINLRIKPRHFFEFVKDIKFYLDREIVEDFEEKESYPVGIIYGDENHKDIKVFFQHYKTFDEASFKWNERKKRINLNNLFVMWEFYDGIHNEELLEEFSKIDIENKMVLTHKKHDLDCSYPIDIFNDNLDMAEIGGKIFKYDGLSGKRYYEKFDYIEFLNKNNK